MRACRPSDPVSRLLPPLISGPVPLTGGLGFALPAAGRLRVLWKMDGSEEAIVLSACLYTGWPGRALGGGPNIKRWVGKDCSLSLSDKNWLGGPHVPCVAEAVDCGRRRGQNGGSIGSARLQDDALGRQWETVPSRGLLFRLALGGNDGYGVLPRFVAL